MQEHRELVRGAPGNVAAQEDHRRLGAPAEREQRAEVRIEGYEDAPFISCTLEDCFIGRGLHPIVRDMDRVVARSAKTGGEEG